MPKTFGGVYGGINSGKESAKQFLAKKFPTPHPEVSSADAAVKGTQATQGAS